MNLAEIVDSIRKAANDWAPAIQALAAIAALAVAVVATRIARRAQAAEEAQATAANAALAEAARIESDRQREAQILAITPMLLPEPRAATWGGEWNVEVTGQVPASNPALSLVVTLRRPSDGLSKSADMGSHPPGAQFAIRIPCADFFPEPGRPAPPGDPHEIVVTYAGPLDQRVVERYSWYFQDRINDAQPASGGLRWRLAHFGMSFTNAAAAKPLQLDFGPGSPPSAPSQ